MNKKLLSSVLLLLILIGGFALAGTTRFGTIKATNPTDIITADITWTKANSPYTLTQPFTVNSETTLAVEPGVTIIMDLNVYLQVDGTIVARGNSTENIFVYGGEIRLTPNSTGWNEQTASGSIIENAVLNGVTITVSNSAKINNNTITGAIDVNGGSPVIINNTIYGSRYAINIREGSPQIKYNNLIGGITSNSGVRFPIISNNNVVGSVTVSGGSPIISSNLITSITSPSIGIGLTGYNFGDDKLYGAIVTDNIVVGFLTGICWNAGEGAIIARNLIENCSGEGLSIGSNAIVENNTIRNSSIGIRIYNFNGDIPPSDPFFPPTILNNNIEDNAQYNIYSYCTRNLNATYNWWGTTDTQAINQTIYDHKSESNLGHITFVPFLTEPNPQAMPDPNMLTQLPTPIPMPNSNPTNVAGVINSNTTWTPANSPYIFVGDVTIAPGVTLIINPGVTIDFNSWSLIIEGTLHARGNESSRIKFQSSKQPVGAWPPRIYFTDNSTRWNENTGAGCIIEYAEITVSNFQYETILGGSPKISNNLIINYGNDAAAVRTNGLVTNNTIMGGYRGIVAENGTILQNIIKDADQGIACGFISYDPIYHPTIIGNLIMNNSAGIRVSSCSPYIANNTIVNNKYGIHFDDYAFYRNAFPVGVVYNNIDSNDYAVFVEYEGSQISINMTYNWWGTTDASLIDQKIYDQKDNGILSLVNYAPFLTTPAVSPDSIPPPTPSPSPTPTPSPTPKPTPAPTPSPTNQTISRIQSYQYGAGLGAENEPSVQTSITLANAPIQGNVLISVIGIQVLHTTVTGEQGVVTPPSSFEAATVASINETGVIWTRQVRGNSTAYNLDVEIWLGVVVSQASPTITIDLGSLPFNSRITALTIDICEYSGIAADSPLDKTAANSGFGSMADTGRTAPTTQPNELWIGAILFESSVQQTSPTNGFLLLDGQPNATGGRICTAFLEKIVDEQGTANSGTTRKYGDELLFGAWVGCIATFSSTPVATSTPTPSLSNGTDWDIFSVESNSTVTKLAFNSTSSELTFVVHGPSGTAGYVKATIAKSLVPNAENIAVYLDGKQLDYEVTSNADSWLLYFTYTHSTHQVSINLATNTSENTLLGMEHWIWVVVAISVVVICISLELHFKKRKQS